MLHSHEAQQLSSTYMHQWVISPANDNDAEQTISISHWYKQIFARLTQVKNEGREAWHTIYITYINNVPEAQYDSKLSS